LSSRIATRHGDVIKAPLSLFGPAWVAVLPVVGGVALALGMLLGTTRPDVEYECEMAADVAKAVTHGEPLYRNITEEWVGNDWYYKPWQLNCGPVFQRRGLVVLSSSATLPVRVGARLSRPVFQSPDHATIRITEHCRSCGGGMALSVERRERRWIVTSWRRTGDSWPTVHHGVPPGLSAELGAVNSKS
jgi:hypothetical protein